MDEQRNIQIRLQRSFIFLGQRARPRAALTRGQEFLLRGCGALLVTAALLIGWVTNWFHAEQNLSRYPQVQLTYQTCNFERIVHSRGATHEQIVLVTSHGRFVMEDQVWKKHFKGADLAHALARGGTVHAWLHPKFRHVLRGFIDGPVDVPPLWGLEYDQRNMAMGAVLDIALGLGGIALTLRGKFSKSGDRSAQPNY